MAPLGLSSALARITIRPDLGAGLTSFDVMHRNAWTPVFRPVDPETGHPFSLSNILLVPFSGRVSGGGFAFDGAFHAVEPNMPTERYPIHGSAFSAAWTVVETSDHAVTLSLEGTGPGPFHYDALMTYRLDGATLVMELVVTNKAALALPYGLGFHPWFVRDHDTRLAARADRVWLERDDHLPRTVEPVSRHPDLDFMRGSELPRFWVNNWFDGWDRKARIEWPDRGLAVLVETSDLLDQYVLFSPSGDADFFCFEPVSHPVDAFNLPEGPVSHGMVKLEPGERIQACARFIAQPL
ncbi:MAG: aldose 1-epimerase [Aquamicrobium sp.]|uniref:aldose 1-epimerase n=1 Tax=Mesorhizobium sp. Pch-S TaxID=2082387 RepID=UPI0010113EDF|nr:aldose 1-epimerase [Mesorhizobium sp. Pch-S]MBR2686839.1 aldose 1-epimerase [Aquamicrobium sp.]QAZ46627.1 aldose 1-epimerase [Mesorhizobium sp. Pch-S]